MRRHMEIDVSGQIARELRELPRIVGAPVDDRGRAFAPDQIERFEPNFVTHEDAENNVRLKCPNMLDQAEVEIGEVAILLAIERIEQLDLVPKRRKCRQKIGMFIAFAPRRVSVGVPTEYAEDFHKVTSRSSFSRATIPKQTESQKLFYVSHQVASESALVFERNSTAPYEIV